ncbi:VWA domain-containing protein [Gulosibacter chungangensis]|uniref:VWA domain-containing protein n=2 Tax=Gulosibacter chungangensis TaxID=979746 RepID=A0A7J5B9Q4_9MICO|nr:VWA domain-containing protein [Gulosibacter chungangensis]
MAGYSPEQALREYLRRGGRDRTGLDDLSGRIQQRRRELLERHNLGGTLQEVKHLLDEAVLQERGQLARDVTMDDTDRAFRELRLQELPDSPAAAVANLAEYDWQSRDARKTFERIRDLLGREQLEARFQGMKQALENATEEDRAAITEMLRDLNELLDKHARGEDTPEEFERFMAKHGDAFPEQPQSIEELIDALAKRSAAAQRMLNSMTPEQREELMALSQQAFGSPELMEQLARLDSGLQSLRPGEDWSGSEQFEGQEGLGLGDGTGALQDLADLDRLAEQLAGASDRSPLSTIDVDALARHLGEDAAVSARDLAAIERAMRNSDFLRRGADGDLRLSPAAIRRLGRSLLRDAANRLSSRTGQRDTRHAGAAGEQTGASRPWEFGDSEPWDVGRTITNAIVRGAPDLRVAPQPNPDLRVTPQANPDLRVTPQANPDLRVAPKGRIEEPPPEGGFDTVATLPTQQTTRTSQPTKEPPRRTKEQPRRTTGPRIRIEVGDVEVRETEARTRAAVALLVDTSYSMAAEGRWLPMKRTALALHQLVATRFRNDDLQLISFGRLAQQQTVESLTAMPPVHEQGTNLHHALALANRFFRAHPGTQPVLLVVTDGEPTAHLLPGGTPWFNYPPDRETLAATITELDRVGRFGAQTTFFRLGDDPGLAQFLTAMARRVQGTVVAPDPSDLGAAVVGEYLRNRRDR